MGGYTLVAGSTSFAFIGRPQAGHFGGSSRWSLRSEPMEDASVPSDCLKRAAGCIPQMGYAVNLHAGFGAYSYRMLANSTSTAPVCPACAKPMELVARIEAEGGLPAVEGYHCYPCDTDLVIEVE